MWPFLAQEVARYAGALHISKKSQGEFDHFFKKKLFAPVSRLKAVLPSNITPNDFPRWESLSKNRFIRDF